MPDISIGCLLTTFPDNAKMYTIRVDSTPSLDPSFRDVSEAIKWTYDMAGEVDRLSKEIKDSRVSGIACDWGEVNINIEANNVHKTIAISAQDAGIELVVRAASTSPHAIAQNTAIPDVVCMRWPNFTSTWHRRRSLARLLLCPSLAFVQRYYDYIWLYPSVGAPLAFSSILSIDTGRPMLYWQWDDDDDVNITSHES